jgi:hypothetical protein
MGAVPEPSGVANIEHCSRAALWREAFFGDRIIGRAFCAVPAVWLVIESAPYAGYRTKPNLFPRAASAFRQG